MEESSITENEKLQVLTSMEHEHDKEGAAKEVIINGEDEDVFVEEKQPPAVGFINHIISNFTPAAGKEQGEEEKKEKEDRKDDVEEKPIGLINHIISSFAPGDKQQEEEEEIGNKVSEEDNKRGGGGLFTHIMSNLVSSAVSSPRSPDAGKAGDHVFDNAKKTDGNGVIDNIVSNLPTPLPGTSYSFYPTLFYKLNWDHLTPHVFFFY